MKFELGRDPTRELEAAGYTRLLSTDGILWRDRDGRVLTEPAALEELDKQAEEEEG